MGAMLDRNGLRPGRFVVTSDHRVIGSSEVGVLPDLSAGIVFFSSYLFICLLHISNIIPCIIVEFNRCDCIQGTTYSRSDVFIRL